jgi:hypothetical protein
MDEVKGLLALQTQTNNIPLRKLVIWGQVHATPWRDELFLCRTILHFEILELRGFSDRHFSHCWW